MMKWIFERSEDGLKAGQQTVEAELGRGRRIAVTFLLLLGCIAAMGQSWSVRTLGNDARHEFNSVTGCPGQWPVAVDFIPPGGTNSWADRVTWTEAQLSNVYRVIGPAFTNWHTTTWRRYREAQASNEIYQAQAREAAVKATFDDIANVDTNTLTASNLMAIIRRQNVLLMNLRSKLEGGAAGASVQAQGIRAQSIDGIDGTNAAPVRRRTLKRAE